MNVIQYNKILQRKISKKKNYFSKFENVAFWLVTFEKLAGGAGLKTGKDENGRSKYIRPLRKYGKQSAPISCL